MAINEIDVGEVRQLIAGCAMHKGVSARYPTVARIAALISISAWSNLKPREVLALRVADLEHLVLPVEAWRTVRRWLAFRRERLCHWVAGAPLLCNLRGGSLLPSVVRRSLHRRGRRAGLHVSPRTLQRTSLPFPERVPFR